MKNHKVFLKKILTVCLIAVGTLLVADVSAQDQAALIAEGEKLVKASDCFQCHRIPTKLIGPSYKDVANKYKGADDAKVTELAGKVIKGGGGNWGTQMMRAHPGLTEADAKKMVLWILSLADGATTTTTVPTEEMDVVRKTFPWYDWRRYAMALDVFKPL